MNTTSQRPPVIRFGVRAPMRDGLELNATLYLPGESAAPGPAIFTLTPYGAQTYHDVALYFAGEGFPFLAVDSRGRGDSEGEFTPYLNEGRDGHDLVEWIARQPYCNGKVVMWGGSYSGYNQWTTAAEAPPSLAAIAPVASPYIGEDFPLRRNLMRPYVVEWLTLVWGRTSQERLFYASETYWYAKFSDWHRSGEAFSKIDAFFGIPSQHFQSWVAHPRQGAFWDQFNPTPEAYGRMDLPVLTITGAYDGDQAGALKHYREHLAHASPAARERHHLVIGPWDHAGTREPKAHFEGITVEKAALINLRELHRDWYRWVLGGGVKPAFLQKPVAYYVMGAECWRYADSLEEVTASTLSLHLDAALNPDDIFHSGTLALEPPQSEGFGEYRYDPADVSMADVEGSRGAGWWVDQRAQFASSGKALFYHSAPFPQDRDVCGALRLSAWIAIDQPDTDFRASVYEVLADGTAVFLGEDAIRARYREGLREERLIDTDEPLAYDFDRFPFIARTVRKGSRLRLVIGAINSIHDQKNYNAGGVVADETIADARPVRVRVLHGGARGAVLTVPLGRA